ncbi:hypothetical protein T08_3239 [Trichinella sp. T8]|nr:hypothetical protein T08_3239 [Trichinella sp. T8]
MHLTLFSRGEDVPDKRAPTTLVWHTHELVLTTHGQGKNNARARPGRSPPRRFATRIRVRKGPLRAQYQPLFAEQWLLV